MLLLDIGNTTVKYAKVMHGKITESYSLDINAAPINSVLQKISISNISKIFFASSNQSYSEEEISQSLKKIFSISPTAIHSQKQFGKLRNGYDDYKQLGVDRWLNMIVAWQRYQDTCCVISCGTCITYDEIDTNGQHLGGLILPGLPLNRSALSTLLKTKLSNAPMIGYTRKNTQTALNSGANISAIATLNHLVTQFIKSNQNTRNVFLTGGDASFLSKHIHTKIVVNKDIPLKGLLAIANSDNNG